MTVEAAVAVVIALQFAAFGWRVNREIAVGDEERRTWLPVADYLNIVMILSTTGLCIVVPIVTGEFGIWSTVMLCTAVIFIAFHPITTAGHYGLISGRGRRHYLRTIGDYPYLTGEEAISFVISMVLALAAAVWAYMSFSTAGSPA